MHLIIYNSDMKVVNVYLRDGALTDYTVPFARGQYCSGHLGFRNRRPGDTRYTEGEGRLLYRRLCILFYSELG